MTSQMKNSPPTPLDTLNMFNDLVKQCILVSAIKSNLGPLYLCYLILS